jgi:hypothetical protein
MIEKYDYICRQIDKNMQTDKKKLNYQNYTTAISESNSIIKNYKNKKTINK